MHFGCESFSLENNTDIYILWNDTQLNQILLSHLLVHKVVPMQLNQLFKVGIALDIILHMVVDIQIYQFASFRNNSYVPRTKQQLT